MNSPGSCRFLLIVAAAALAAPFVWAQDEDRGKQEDPSHFRISVDTVSLSLTVLDKDARIVGGLGEDNFKIYEDGAEQTVRFFSQETVPLKMVILLDTSASMRQKMSLAQDAAVHFVRSLEAGDEVQVVEFNDRVLTLADFTSDFDVVTEAIRSTQAAGATSLYNAIYISLKDLTNLRRDELDRQAIVVLSDGADTRSLVGFEDIRQLVRKSRVIVYAISLRASKDDLKKKKYYTAKYELDVLAEESGGQSLAPKELDDLAGVYDEIAAELKSQYSLGYISTNSEQDGSWRYIQIVSKEPGLSIRTRSGYYAPRPSRRPRRSPR